MKGVISKQMEVYKDYLKMLSQGHTFSVLCYSAGGLGKTYTTIKILKSLNLKYSYINGVATAVELYKALYDNRDKILIIDDVETMFQDDRIINLLKAALWEADGKREIAYRTSSTVLDYYPESFEYTGKIIILANEIKGRFDESQKALLSRCLTYELIYSFDEIINISQTIVDKEKTLNTVQKKKVKQILKEHIKPQHNFNFRLLNRLMSFVRYDFVKAEGLFLNSINVDEEVEILNRLLSSGQSVTQQIEEYKKETGNSKATFFRKKKAMIRKKVLSVNK